MMIFCWSLMRKNDIKSTIIIIKIKILISRKKFYELYMRTLVIKKLLLSVYRAQISLKFSNKIFYYKMSIMIQLYVFMNDVFKQYSIRNC